MPPPKLTVIKRKRASAGSEEGFPTDGKQRPITGPNKRIALTRCSHKILGDQKMQQATIAPHGKSRGHLGAKIATVPSQETSPPT